MRLLNADEGSTLRLSQPSYARPYIDPSFRFHSKEPQGGYQCTATNLAGASVNYRDASISAPYGYPQPYIGGPTPMEIQYMELELVQASGIRLAANIALAGLPIERAMKIGGAVDVLASAEKIAKYFSGLASAFETFWSDNRSGGGGDDGISEHIEGRKDRIFNDGDGANDAGDDSAVDGGGKMP